MMIVAVTGHRPNKLWGYDLSEPKYKILHDNFFDLLIENNTTHCISGMALGVDTVFAIAAIHYRYRRINKSIILEAAIPCLNQEKLWNKKDQRLYHKILKKFDMITYVNRKPFTPDLMQKRNEYMVDKCDLLLAVWNEDKRGGTYNCIRYAKNLNKKIIYINIKEIL